MSRKGCNGNLFMQEMDADEFAFRDRQKKHTPSISDELLDKVGALFREGQLSGARIIMEKWAEWRANCEAKPRKRNKALRRGLGKRGRALPSAQQRP